MLVTSVAKGENLLPNFTLCCIYGEESYFLVIPESRSFQLRPQRTQLSRLPKRTRILDRSRAPTCSMFSSSWPRKVNEEDLFWPYFLQ